MTSSYIQNSFGTLFETLTDLKSPKVIVEFGILHGYSLDAFLKKSNEDCQVYAYDLFDKFPYNAANLEYISNRFQQYSDRLTIKQSDFFESMNDFSNDSIDLLHIDIANDGETFRVAVGKYLPEVSEGGIMILEGGSVARDSVSWMIDYNKPSISKYLSSIKSSVFFLLSMTFHL